MPETTSLLIAGAGINGNAVAYYLREEGFAGDILVCDPRGIGQGNTSIAVGGFRNLRSNPLSVAVMKMVRSDIGASGVTFTLDTESGFRDVVFITGCYGLGETIVQGKVDPDEFYVHKPTLKQGFRCVLRRRLGGKQIRMIYGKGGGSRATLIRTVPSAERQRFCTSDTDVLSLADIAVQSRSTIQNSRHCHAHGY
jgi:hypothetical protein